MTDDWNPWPLSELDAEAPGAGPGMSGRATFGGVARRHGGRRFAGALRRDRFDFLEMEQRKGIIYGLEMEVPFELYGTTGEVIDVYRADAVYHLASDGRRVVESVTRMGRDDETGEAGPSSAPGFALRRRMFESQYSTRIHLVTEADLTALPQVLH
jgi:hypothetical protein